jgi:hypothetical protein
LFEAYAALLEWSSCKPTGTFFIENGQLWCCGG